MPTTNWDEIRTAFFVARLGTVSGAADALGVHHATVIRHVDALENRIGVKLFQRHARGYTATEAGSDLLQVGQATEDQLSQLVARIRGRGTEVQGELVVTTVSGFSELLLPLLAEFQARNPQIQLRYLSDNRLFRLEYGEAHVAIRAGNAPQEPDNVVQPLWSFSRGIYAAPSYIARHGKPEPGGWDGHRFVGNVLESGGPPFERWLNANVPAEQIVFRAAEVPARIRAVIEGIGIGSVPPWVLSGHPELIEVMPPLPEWETRLWLVTHVDLHRTTKVQRFLTFLKDAAKGWKS